MTTIKTWTAWVRQEDDEPWQPVLSGSEERDVITATNAMKLDGELLVLPSPLDPNTPIQLRSEHGEGRRFRQPADRGEPAAVRRRLCVEDA